MVRTELREHIFKMLFQIEFNTLEEMPKHLELYFEELTSAKEKDKEYIQKKLEAVIEKLEEIDAILNEKATGWKTSRMNKVDLAILRLAVYESGYTDGEDEDEEQTTFSQISLPDVQKGETLPVTALTITEGKTKPPA